MPTADYFTGAAGTKYLVYDCAFSAGKHEQRPISDPAATARVFVQYGGMKRCDTFKRSDLRILAERALEPQLRSAEYLASELFDPTNVEPGARGAVSW